MHITAMLNGPCAGRWEQARGADTWRKSRQRRSQTWVGWECAERPRHAVCRRVARADGRARRRSNQRSGGVRRARARRRSLRHAAKANGRQLDVSVGTVSRWETGAEPIGRQTQLAVLLPARAYFGNGHADAERSVE
jgi:hypothetical protein